MLSIVCTFDEHFEEEKYHSRQSEVSLEIKKKTDTHNDLAKIMDQIFVIFYLFIERMNSKQFLVCIPYLLSS